MLSDDVFRSRLQATIAALRYWVPTIADAASVREASGEGYWKLSVAPTVAHACPFELMLRSDQRCDLVIAGETFEDQPIERLEMFEALVSAIAEGRVIQRHVSAAATGRPLAVETIVTLDRGAEWRAMRRLDGGDRPALAVGGTVPPDAIPHDAIVKDRHFLPYRR